ncbi:MAG: SIS domain-containing protein [Anaerolineales bacterium]|nr:SIS domain-containing protein [Anaerolineales bacterium]
MKNSVLYKEIFEQPDVIENFLQAEWHSVDKLARDLQGSFDHVLIAARGTSDNAARYAKYTWGSFNQLPVELAAPSLFTLYKRPPRMPRTLVLGISQSGQSPDIVAVMEEARRQGLPSIVITDYPESPLAVQADHVIGLHCNGEKAVCATKTYTTSLTAISLLSAFMAADSSRLEQIRSLPAWMKQTLEMNDHVAASAERYRYLEHCAVIGRGYNYCTGFEFALKIQELTGIVAEPYSSADFRHGPIAMVDAGAPVLAIAPGGMIFDDMVKLAKEVRQRNGELLIVSNDKELLGMARVGMEIPGDVPDWLTPMVTILPGQLFAMYLAATMGIDVDKPQGLSKVTETW